MLHGRMQAPASVPAPRLRPAWIAAVLFAAAALAVYALVEIVPMP
jgi:hypothetical protein